MLKQKRDAELTKAKIIENAMLLFSKNGFNATTVDEISTESGVNKALIYYYFKNKSGLYEIVMSKVLASIYSSVIDTNKNCTTPITELEAFIKTYADFAIKHPYFPALLLRELSDGGVHLPEKMFTNMRKLFKLLSEILQRGYEQNIFKDIKPIVIHFMIIGTINLLVTTSTLRKKAFEMGDALDTCSECTMDEIANYITEKIKLMLEIKQ